MLWKPLKLFQIICCLLGTALSSICKSVSLLTWTFTGSIQCSTVSAVMFAGRITGSLGGTTHDGMHTAPEGTEIYSTHLTFQISVFFIRNQEFWFFLSNFSLCYGSSLSWVWARLIFLLYAPVKILYTQISEGPRPQVNTLCPKWPLLFLDSFGISESLHEPADLQDPALGLCLAWLVDTF